MFEDPYGILKLTAIQNDYPRKSLQEKIIKRIQLNNLFLYCLQNDPFNDPFDQIFEKFWFENFNIQEE